MNCPHCKLTAQIKGCKYAVRGDDSPDRETELYLVQELVCRNPQCPRNGETVKTIEHRLEL